MVLIGLIIWNVGNYAFFVIAGRSLGPIEYASVAALLSATMLVQIPAGAVQVGISRQIADLPDPEGPQGTWLLRHALWWCVWTGATLAAITGLVIWLVAPSLPVSATIWTALAVMPIPIFSLATGILQGRQRFAPFSASVSMLGAPRPVALLLLLPVVSGLVAAMAASAIAIALAALTSLVLAAPRQRVRSVPSVERWDAFRRTITPLAAGLAGVATLLNLDIIVGRAVFAERTAGLFGAVGVLAKATAVIPQAVAWVLLPKVAGAVARGANTAPMLRIGVAVVASIGAVATVLCVFLSEPIVVLVFGNEYRDGAVYLAPLVGTTTLTGLLLLLMNHQLARGIDRFTWWIAALGLIEAGLFWLFHSSIQQLIVIEVVVGCSGILLYEALYGRSEAGLSRSIIAMRRRDVDSGGSRGG